MMFPVTRRGVLDGGLIALATAAGLVLWPDLPAEMAIHFSASGTPDNYVPRLVGILLLPAVMVVTLIVIRWAESVDPPDERRILAVTSTGTMVLLGVVHVLVLAWNVGYDVPFDAVLVGAVLWAVVLGGYAILREGAIRN